MWEKEIEEVHSLISLYLILFAGEPASNYYV